MSNTHHTVDPLSAETTELQFSQESLFNGDHLGDHHTSGNLGSNSHGSNIPQIRAHSFYSFPQGTTRANHHVSTPINSVLTMPIPGTKLAPEKFRGDFHKVNEFIQHYERLCAQNNVILDADKCETLLRYCSKREKQTIKNIPSFGMRSWGRLREDILRLYDADLDTRRYKVKDVRIFSKKQKEKRIRNLSDWKKYCRAFLRIAGSLLNEEKISTKEYSTYFWQGIPKALRSRIENRLLTRNPVRDLSEPFEVEEVDTAASAILQRDRFDQVLDDSESEKEDSSNDESSSGDEDDETSDSESEDEKEKRRRRRRKFKESSRLSRRSSSEKAKEDPGKKKSVGGSHREVESLLKQMNLLTQDDPQYGIAYYRALKLDPDVAKIIAGPALTRPNNQLYGLRNPSTYQAQRSYIPPPSMMTSQGPVNMYRAPQPSFPRGGEMICYGCGEKGHGLNRCPVMEELINKKQLIRDVGGRLVHVDGSPIRKMPSETYLQAYERDQRPQSHLITVSDDWEEVSEPLASSESERENDEWVDRDWLDETDREDVFAIRNIDWTFAADRPERSIAARKREVLDGVYPPRLKNLAPGKENRVVNGDTGRPVRTGKGAVLRPNKGKDPVPVAKRANEIVPVEVERPRFDASKDDQIVEDKAKEGKIQKGSKDELPEEGKLTEKKPGRQSAISEHVNVLGVLDQVLNAKVELAVGEVIGVSRELSGQLANAIKFRALKSMEPSGLTTLSAQGLSPNRTKTRGLLIKIMMECDGRPIEAIIDTGSQLNIVSEKACKSSILRPIDCSVSISMNDANGGEGKLEGLVREVPLSFGSVRTRANLHVGRHVPFDLLLGRPWQRDNMVSIDEQEDGTYLVFKDRDTLEPRHKALVTPDAIVSKNWDVDPSTWLGKDGPYTFYVNSDAAGTGGGASKIKRTPIAWRVLRNFPYLEEWEAPELELTDDTHPSLKEVEEWLREPMSRIIFEVPDSILQKEIGSEGKDIKPGEINQKSISDFSQSFSAMQIKLGPASVKHEAELAALFSTPASARSDAEAILANLSRVPVPEVLRDPHLRNIVVTTQDGLVVGHCIDDSGFPRTDLMLLNMGLITPKNPEETETSDLDIQYGTGLVHFYPNLGREAPPFWKVPFLIPSETEISVSASKESNPSTEFEIISQKGEAESVVEMGARPHSDSIPSCRDDADPDSDIESVEGNDEVYIPCASCLHHHAGTCAAIAQVFVPSGRIVTNCGIENPNVPRGSTDSLPDLEDVESDSDAEEDEEEGIDQDRRGSDWEGNWEEFKQEVRREIEDEEMSERLAEWELYQEGVRETRQDEETSESTPPIDDVLFQYFRERATSPSMASSAVASAGFPSPPDSPTFFLNDSPADRLHERQQQLRELLQTQHLVITSGKASRCRSPNEYADCDSSPEDIRSKTTEFLEEKTRIRQTLLSHDAPENSALFATSPVQVFTVRVSPTAVEQLFNHQTKVCATVEEEVVKADKILIDLKEEESAPPPDYLATVRPVYTAVRSRLGKRTRSGDEDSSSNCSCESDEISEKLPSPTDTEPIESIMLPRPRRLPKPPVNLRPNRYRQAHDIFIEDPLEFREQEPAICFAPHIIALARDRVLYPYIETNRPGPVTDMSVPIQERIYYPYADLDVHYNVLRTKKLIMVDTRTMRVISPHSPLPAGRTAIFSVLAPRNSPETLIFPGLIWPNGFGPKDLPHVSSRNWDQRFDVLKRTRHSIVGFIQRIKACLADWQLEEIKSPEIALYIQRGNQLAEKHFDREMFFHIIHPTFNPLITRQEAVFLRGAAYSLHRFHHDNVAYAIDSMLRSPQLDVHVCVNLLACGSLDDPRREHVGWKFLEEYERSAQGDNFADSDLAN